MALRAGSRLLRTRSPALGISWHFPNRIWRAWLGRMASPQVRSQRPRESSESRDDTANVRPLKFTAKALHSVNLVNLNAPQAGILPAGKAAERRNWPEKWDVEGQIRLETTRFGVLSGASRRRAPRRGSPADRASGSPAFRRCRLRRCPGCIRWRGRRGARAAPWPGPRRA